jgi:hypothetical protein
LDKSFLIETKHQDLFMQETKVWEMLLKHLGGEETSEDKKKFSEWLNQSDTNKVFFSKVKTLWEDKSTKNESFQQDSTPTFFGRYTKKKIKDILFKQSIGNLIGFTVGIWVTATFSHDTLEKRGLKNLFGLGGRKKVVVNEIPEWLQNGIAILVGFIVLELINHFFQAKKYLLIWNFIKKQFNPVQSPK